jgi:hypothetical protein
VLVQAGIIDAAMQLLVMSMNSMLHANYSSFKIHLYGGGGMCASTQGPARKGLVSSSQQESSDQLVEDNELGAAATIQQKYRTVLGELWLLYA